MKKLNSEEKRTFILHFFYSLIDGILLGALALNEFVLIKGLNATNYQIAFLFQFTVIVLLFSIVTNEFIKRTTKKRRFILIVGIVTRLPLFLLLIFPNNINDASNQIFYQFLFLGIFLIYFFFKPIVLPIINLLLKHNYRHDNFGKLYGYATTANKIIMFAATFAFGLLLDNYNYAYKYVYPVLAILGIFSFVLLTRINYKAPIIKEYKHSIIETVKNSVKKMFVILKQNKPFRDFEVGFLFYGFAWLLTMAVITIFLDRVLQLNYTSVAFYKNSYNVLAILLTPFLGKIIGKINPRKFAAYTFAFMLFFIFFMGLTEFIRANFVLFGIKIYYTLLISYLFYGCFAASMGLLWNIGSAYFCKKGEENNYQAIHLSLTGFRGLFAPLIGIWLLDLIGFSGVFGLGVLSLFFAVLIMIWSLRNKRYQIKN